MTEASAGQRRSPIGNGVPRLDAYGITKRFGRLTVLHDVSLRIGAGEVVALVGENGAGKSSLVACIARILEPEEGEVRLERGAPLPSTPDQVRQAGVEVLWQDHGLCDDLDVVANVFLGRERGRWLIAESQMHAERRVGAAAGGGRDAALDRRAPSTGCRPVSVTARGPRARAHDAPRWCCSTSHGGARRRGDVAGAGRGIRRCHDAGAASCW